MNWDNVYDYYLWSLIPALLMFCWGVFYDLKCLYGFATPDHKFGYCLTDRVFFLPILGLLLVPVLNICLLVVIGFVMLYYFFARMVMNSF